MMTHADRAGQVAPRPDGAKVLPFRPRAARLHPVPDAPVATSSGWYHETAIKESDTLAGKR